MWEKTNGVTTNHRGTASCNKQRTKLLCKSLPDIDSWACTLASTRRQWRTRTKRCNGNFNFFLSGPGRSQAPRRISIHSEVNRNIGPHLVVEKKQIYTPVQSFIH